MNGGVGKERTGGAEAKKYPPFSGVHHAKRSDGKGALWHSIPHASQKKVLAPKKHVADTVTHPGLDRLILVATLLFAFCVGVGSYTLLNSSGYEHRRSAAVQAIIDTPPPLSTLPTRKETMGPIVLNVTEATPEKIASELALVEGKTYLHMGHERAIQLIDKKNDRNKEKLNAKEVLRTIAPQVPESLLRAIDADFYRLLIRQEERLDGVLALSVNSYPYAAGGMRAWERSLANELMPILTPWRSQNYVTFAGKRPFVDMRLGEIDARAVVDKDEKVAFIYAFPSRETLIFASSAAALLAHATSSPSN